MWVEALLPRAHTLHLQNKINGHAESLEIVKLTLHYSSRIFTRAKHSKTYAFRYNIFKHQISNLSGQVMSYFIQKSIVENTACMILKLATSSHFFLPVMSLNMATIAIHIVWLARLYI